MNYENLMSYKFLIDLGCKEVTGPIQRKRGVVSFSIPHSSGKYHFDPKYTDDDKGAFSRARRVAIQGEPTVFFIKPYEENIYDLAFRAFSLNFMGRRNIKDSNLLEWQHIAVKTIFGDRR